MGLLPAVTQGITHDPVSPLAGVYPKELNTGARANTPTHAHSSFTHHHQKVETTQASISR